MGTRPASRSVGLVLGAGGVAGGAWHAGVLAALADLGWDARSADLVVGTSAGSGTAAVLRLGVPPSDLLAGATGEPLSEVGAAYVARAGPQRDIPSPAVGGLPVPSSPAMAMRALAAGRLLRPTAVVAGLMPTGTVPTDVVGERIRRAHDKRWPDRPTWICTVRLSDGARVVFGRDRDDADLATAVEASSAIPGFFTPVVHEGHRYVDGGVHSPTNADLVAELGFDAVVVSSPMSATRAALRRPRWSGARGLHTTTLAREVRRVRASGTSVIVLQPGPEVVDAVGSNPMDPTRRGPVAEVAHETITAHLCSPELTDRLALLGA